MTRTTGATRVYADCHHLSSPSAFGLAALLIAATCLPADAQLPDSVPPVDPDSVVILDGVDVRVLASASAGVGPYAATVRSGLALRSGGAATFLDDAVRAIPGVQLQNRHNYAVGERWVIRGFGARSQFGARGIRFLVDGVPATLPDGQATLDHVDPATLERVEILRGPSAARFGNAAGGVVAFETRLPSREGTVAELRGGGGSDGLASGGLTVEGRSGETAWSASARRLEWDGYRTNRDTGEPYGGAERWTLAGRGELPLAGGSLRLSVSGLDLSARNPGSLPVAELEAEDRPAWGFNVARRTRKTIEQGQIGARWRSTEEPGRGWTTAAWAVRRDLENPIPSDVIGVDRLVLGTRLERAGAAGPLRWSVGGEIERQDDDRRNWENDGGERGALTLDQTEVVTGMGLFVQGAWTASPSLELHAALRADRTRFRAEDRFVSAGDPDDSGERTLSAFSPSLGLLIAPSDGVQLFSSVGSFYETPTTTELANRPEGSGGFNSGLDPRRGWTAEAGLRGVRALGRSGVLQGEVTLFGAWIRDELVPFEVPTDPGRTFFRNAGRVRHQGAEASVQAAWVGGAELRAAFTRLDARFREDADDPRDLAGNRIPGAAPNRFDLTGSVPAGPLRLGADLRWTDEIPADDEGAAEAPSSTLLDLRATAEVRVGGTVLSPWLTLRNVTDELWVASVVPNAFGSRYFEPGPGRTVEIGTAVRLGR